MDLQAQFSGIHKTLSSEEREALKVTWRHRVTRLLDSAANTIFILFFMFFFIRHGLQIQHSKLSETLVKRISSG